MLNTLKLLWKCTGCLQIYTPPPDPHHEAAVGSMEQNDCSTEVTTCIAIPECGRSSMRTSAKRGQIKRAP